MNQEKKMIFKKIFSYYLGDNARTTVVDVPYGRLQGTKFFLGYNIKKKWGKKREDQLT